MQKLVIAISGKSGARKSTVARYLKKRFPKSEVFRFSDSLREFYAWLRNDFLPSGATVLPNVEASTSELQQLSTTIRRIFGESSLARAILARVKQSFLETDIVIVEGVRRLIDIESLREDSSITFRHIHMEAVPSVSHQRHAKRNEKPGDADLSLGQFLTMVNAEAEAQIDSLIPFADIVIDNSGTQEALDETLRQLFDEWTV